MLRKINTMKELEDICYEGLRSEDNSIAVEISIPGREGNSEFIITKRQNIKGKLNYYKKFYNENLVNVKNETIRILSAGHGNVDLWENENEDTEK